MLYLLSNSDNKTYLDYLHEYYQKHPDKFIEDFYGVKLLWYQRKFLKLSMKGCYIRLC